MITTGAGELRIILPGLMTCDSVCVSGSWFGFVLGCFVCLCVGGVLFFVAVFLCIWFFFHEFIRSGEPLFMVG